MRRRFPARYTQKPMRQRAIPEGLLWVKFKHGTCEHDGRGCKRWRVGRKSFWRLHLDLGTVLKCLDTLDDVHLVEAGDGTIVTAGHQYRRL